MFYKEVELLAESRLVVGYESTPLFEGTLVLVDLSFHHGDHNFSNK